MKRLLETAVVVCALAAGAGRWAVAAQPATSKAEKTRAAAEMVAEALRQEIDGENSKRKELLNSALDRAPDCEAAYWHSGFVRLYDQWLTYYEVPLFAAKDDRLMAYRRLREKYPQTIEGRMALAKWCGGHKLPDQQRAHLVEVLQINPDHAEARRLLGQRRIDGAWLTAEEIAEAVVRARRAAAALRKWRAKLTRIRDDLGHRRQPKREIAKNRLLAIDDPAVIPAMETVFSRHGEETALLLIEALANIPDAEASAALARQAVFSTWPSVRGAAAEKLKSRDFHSFVPLLLAAMGTPVQSRGQLYAAPGGRLVYRHMFSREGQDRNQVAFFDTEYRPTLLFAENPEEAASSRAALAEARRRDAMMKARARELAVAQQNTTVRQFNERIGAVLSMVTGANLPPTADAWWRWWNDYNEVYIAAGPKPIEGIYRRDAVSFEDSYKYTPSTRPTDNLPSTGPTTPTGAPTAPRRTSTGSVPGSRFSAGLPAARYECLAAGTPVWTETGLVPVEKVRVGDRVLSQEVETGELAYKPVVRTTFRPPATLVKMEAGKEPIVCSGGHPFWVSGTGWVKARLLQAGARLHGAIGTTEVRSVGEADAAATYNLIVADFHTYFVGKTKILSHDNTIRKPGTTTVPGLASR